MGILQELGIKHDTDKVNENHSVNGKSLLDIYEKYFFGLKDSNINLLEIGVLRGNSLRTWKEYFLNGNIYGLDIDENCKIYEEDRINILIGSQNDKKIRDYLVENKIEFDIILDDGSHINELTLYSFELYFPTIKSGGYYIIEDTHCTYEDAMLWTRGMHLTKELNVSFINDRKIFNQFVLNKIEDMDHKLGEIDSIHFHFDTCIIKKV